MDFVPVLAFLGQDGRLEESLTDCDALIGLLIR
jgi:hypothetical protein